MGMLLKDYTFIFLKTHKGNTIIWIVNLLSIWNRFQYSKSFNAQNLIQMFEES